MGALSVQPTGAAVTNDARGYAIRLSARFQLSGKLRSAAPAAPAALGGPPIAVGRAVIRKRRCACA